MLLVLPYNGSWLTLSMSSGTLITPIVSDPYFSMVFVNQRRFRLAVWLKIEGEWWVTPDVRPRGRTGIVPAFEGATIEWRAVSADAVRAYNLLHGTTWTTQSEEIMGDEDVAGWQGQFVVTYGMLGRSIRLALF